jgi:polyphosphate kinase
VGIDDPTLFFNRELSEIDFNWRVLQQAADERTPLLERPHFLAITASNVDELFQKRVGGLKRQRAAGVTELSPDGRDPAQQLDLVLASSRRLMTERSRLWREELCPALGRIGVEVVAYQELTPAQRDEADAYFQQALYAILTPLAVDPTRPFPLISNLSLSLAVTLEEPTTGVTQFARVKVSSGLPRWVRFAGSRRVLPVERLIAQHVHTLFPGMTVTGAYVFSLVRNAYLEHQAEVATDLIEMISDALREQRFAQVVRLDVEAAMPPELREFLRDQLEVDHEDVFEEAELLRMVDLHSLVADPEPALSYQRWTPQTTSRLQAPSGAEPDIFAVIRQGDVLVHHPYESYDSSVLRLLREAAADPAVIGIKQTVYRTNDQSQAMSALLAAAEAGKQVSVLIEIQARFDEAANISWGEVLEEAGVHVAYGVPNLKTHAKAILVIRQEQDGIRCYCHIGTGNYNEKTAQVYCDLSLLTCSKPIGDDLINLFHSLTGYAPAQRYGSLLVAPAFLSDSFIALIEGEIERQRQHGDGRIIAKMNGLDDVKLIQQLYRASQAGVSIDLIVRGLCRLRPGIPGISDNIRVISIIGRFLEHDRVYYFGSGGEERVYLGSADWRRRNLHERVEVVAPVSDDAVKRRIVDMLNLALSDNRLAWELSSAGSYRQREAADGEPEINFQLELMRRAKRTSEPG